MVVNRRRATDPGRCKPGRKPFDSFRAYWEKAVQQPFTKWLELEETYHFVRENAPGLMEVTFPEAREGVARERIRKAAEGTTKEEVPTKQGERNDLSDSDKSQSKRAGMNGISRDTQNKLDRLARDFPDLHSEVKGGKLSVHAACIRAGIVKVPTALDQVKRAWGRPSVEERREIREWFKADPRRAGAWSSAESTREQTSASAAGP